MVLLGSLCYSLFALLGLSVLPPDDSRPTEAAVGVSCRGLHVRDGSVSCNNNGHKTSCRVKCGGRDRGLFTCTEDHGWTPGLPPCAKPMEDDNDDDYDYDKSPASKDKVGASCRGLNVRDGYASCVKDGYKTFCRVKCGGRDRGLFICSDFDGWTTDLPNCAKPMDGMSQEVLNACPSDEACAERCQDFGRQSGHCMGEICNCTSE